MERGPSTEPSTQTDATDSAACVHLARRSPHWMHVWGCPCEIVAVVPVSVRGSCSCLGSRVHTLPIKICQLPTVRLLQHIVGRACLHYRLTALQVPPQQRPHTPPDPWSLHCSKKTHLHSIIFEPPLFRHRARTACVLLRACAASYMHRRRRRAVAQHRALVRTARCGRIRLSLLRPGAGLRGPLRLPRLRGRVGQGDTVSMARRGRRSVGQSRVAYSLERRRWLHQPGSCGNLNQTFGCR